MPAVSKKKFVNAIVAGKTPSQAYKAAGGSKNSNTAHNGYAYAKQADVKRMINEGLQQKVLYGLVGLTSLTEKAIEKLSTLVDSTDEKVSLQASKVVLDKAREFLPKEVNINNTYKVTHDEEQDQAFSRLEEIASKLLTQGTNGEGGASRILEAVRVKRSDGVQYIDGESGDSESESSFTVPTEQETETST